MTITAVNATSGPYLGNGLSDEYSYGFTIEDKTQLQVYETDNLGNTTLLVVDSDYTVNDIGVDGGGTVTRLAGVLPSNYTWYIRSNRLGTQDTDFVNQGGFFPQVHEDQFDHVTMLTQQLEDKVNRCIRVTPYNSENPDFEITSDAAGRASKFLGFDENGDVTLELQTNVPAFGGSLSQVTAIATAGQTVFTTPTYTVGSNTLQVHLDGVRQERGYAYTEDGPTQITFTEGIKAGRRVTFTVGDVITSALSGPASSITTTDGSGNVQQFINNLPCFYVKNKGAVWDGATDDSTVINTTINLAVAAGGGRVILPPGTGYCATDVVVKNGVSLESATHGTTTLKFGGGARLITEGFDDLIGTNGWFVGADSVPWGFRISGMRVFGNKTSNTVANAYLLFHTKTGNFTVGQVVTGAVSGKTGTITQINASADDANAGCLLITTTDGDFTPGETITDPITGSATLFEPVEHPTVCIYGKNYLMHDVVIHDTPGVGLYTAGANKTGQTDYRDRPGCHHYAIESRENGSHGILCHGTHDSFWDEIIYHGNGGWGFKNNQYANLVDGNCKFKHGHGYNNTSGDFYNAGGKIRGGTIIGEDANAVLLEVADSSFQLIECLQIPSGYGLKITANGVKVSLFEFTGLSGGSNPQGLIITGQYTQVYGEIKGNGSNNIGFDLDADNFMGFITVRGFNATGGIGIRIGQSGEASESNARLTSRDNHTNYSYVNGNKNHFSMLSWTNTGQTHIAGTQKDPGSLDDIEFIGHGVTNTTSKNTLQSATFAVDAVADIDLTIAHGCPFTPDAKDCSLSVITGSAVHDYDVFVKFKQAPDATNVYVRAKVVTASGTGGAVARVGLKVDTSKG